VAELSSTLLYIAFILYLIGTFFFGGSIRDKRGKDEKPNRWARLGIAAAILGFLSQLGYFRYEMDRCWTCPGFELI